MSLALRRTFCLLALLSLGAAAFGTESAAVRIGERLFDDSRFSFGATLVGLAVSCRACHPSASDASVTRDGVPARTDGHLTTPRNGQAIVEAFAPVVNGWGLLHWDGEFARPEELVKETFLGRNFGWLPDERAAALRHFAQVVRKVGGGDGLSYAVLLRGEDPRIPEALRLPVGARIDPASASDEAIVEACARLVVAFVQAQQFSRDADGRYNGSPYDAFVEANFLPRAPRAGETPHEYARRLHHAIAALAKPAFVAGFGETEFIGLRIFFRGTTGYGRESGAGNCAECHVPPGFADGAFHNTGAAQDAYDTAKGRGAFMDLVVPSLAKRAEDFDRWLPPTAQHPQAAGAFRSSADGKTVQADLGLWNVYGNPDLPAPQAVVERKLNPEGRLTPDELLTLTLGRFKTPTLRDLDRSAPYLHNGSQRTLEDVIRFYQRLSDLARAGAMRNAPKEYAVVKLGDTDVEPLAAFLRALNER
jgi:cytochrome c peroxidase